MLIQIGICKGKNQNPKKKKNQTKKPLAEQHWDPNIYLSFQDTFIFKGAYINCFDFPILSKLSKPTIF